MIKFSIGLAVTSTVAIVTGYQGKAKDNVKQIKATFSRIREIEKAIYLEREEQAKEHYGINGLPRSQRLKDPTGQRAIKRMEPILGVYLNDGTYVEKPEEWITVYQETCNFFEYSEAKQIIQKRFIERKSIERVLLDIGCLSRKTFFTLQDQIIYFALGVAEGMGIFRNQQILKEA